jgi:hypothetical protein
MKEAPLGLESEIEADKASKYAQGKEGPYQSLEAVLTGLILEEGGRATVKVVLLIFPA